MWGRVAKDSMYFNVWIDDNHVVDNERVQSYGNHEYAKLTSFDRQIILDSDTAAFELSLVPNPAVFGLCGDFWMAIAETFGRQLPIPFDAKPIW